MVGTSITPDPEVSPMAPKRNDPCPCGSGRKYKHCCGKPAGGGYWPGGADSSSQDPPPGIVPDLPPEAVERARATPIWEADMVSIPAVVHGHETSRYVAVMVVADRIPVWHDVRMVNSTEAREVGTALALAVGLTGEWLGVLPKGVMVRRVEVADAVQTIFRDWGCKVYADSILPGVDEAAADLAGNLSPETPWPAIPPPPTWEAWGLPSDVVGKLFSACARFYRAAPWTWFDTVPPLAALWSDGEPPWVVSVMGSEMGEDGLSIYTSLEDFEAAMAWDEDEVPFQNLEGWIIYLGFQHRDALARVMLKEVSAAGWEVAALEAYPHILPILTPGGGLQAERVRRLAELADAVTALGEEMKEGLRSPEGVSISRKKGRLELRYELPPETGDLDKPAEGITDRVLAEIMEEIREGDLASEDEIRKALAERMGAYNAEPLDELAGISPTQAQDLLMGGVMGEGPLFLSDVLELEELEASPFLFNARVFLAAADEAGGAPLTQTGNLKRVFVAEMLDRMLLPDGYLDELHRMNKVVNEEDVGPLHVLRVNLELARLIRKRKGRFLLTRKGRDLMKPEAAGALFRHLFSVHFGEFNLEYPRRGPDRMGLQRAFPLLLWKMSLWARDWTSLEELTSAILPETVIEMGKGEGRYERRPAMDLYYMILDPLIRFGLLEEVKHDPPEDQPYPRWNPSAVHFRITPLFRRFLVFEWE